MSFMNHLEDEMNVKTTENGAIGYKTTKKEIVDFNFKLPSYRKASDKDILLDFKRVWNEDKELAYKYLFYLRDARGGVGERKIFRAILPCILDDVKDDMSVFHYIMKYGRMDDIFAFFDTPMEETMLAFVRMQLFNDAQKSLKNEPISLLAKWLPSINASNYKTRELAKRFIKALDLDNQSYRKTLAKLREYIDVVERKMCSNEWGKIDYQKVPSNANLKYKNAFFRHDEERRRAYLESVQKGEAKINSSVLFPYEIVNKYRDHRWWCEVSSTVDTTLEELWKALPNYVEGNSNIMVVRDGSGSMQSPAAGSSTTALDVATALSIYFSERCEGQFKDKFITFSHNPQFVDLSKYTTLRDKLAHCYKFDDCSNTNIEATFDLILKIAVNNNLKQEEIPNLLIISDMEFDGCTYGVNKKALFKNIATKYRTYGYELPKLIFWNVNSRTNTIPLTENENGVILVSGFSTGIAKMVLSEKLDPYEALVEELNSERYKDIKLKRD